MSKPDSQNPYESPRFDPKSTTFDQIGDDVPFQGTWTMDYTGGFGMIHANPNWLTNCFLAGLCGLIPIVGAIVLVGYGYETAELLHRSHGRRYWDFNFNRFGDYLSRGLGPFLVGLVFGIGQFFLNIGLQFGIAILFAGAAGAAGNQNPNQGADMAILIASLGSNLVILIFSIVLPLIYIPLQIRSGLTRDVGEGFQFSKGFDFTSKVWLEIILMSLFMALISIVALPIIILTCCVGFLPVMGYATLLNGWFSFQLYRLYLSRGGQPVQFKPLPTSAA